LLQVNHRQVRADLRVLLDLQVVYVIS
jgi:hypothetical protein